MDDEITKATGKPIANKDLLIDENKWNMLKSFPEDCLSKIKKPEDFTNIKEKLALIGQIINSVTIKPKQEEDVEEYLTLSQCIEEINKPEPGAESESESEAVSETVSETDRKPEPGELLKALKERTEHDKDEFISSEKCDLKTNENAAVDTHSSENVHSNGDFSCIKVKEEPIEDGEGNHDFHGQAILEPARVEDREAFQTPESTKTNKIGSKSIGRVSSRRSRLSSREIEKSNRKITDFFPISSKSKNPISTNMSKTKSTDADNLFIFSAVKGDGNFCIFCQKKFSANYLKPHLINQHQVSKDIFPTVRKIKKDK